ncbi:MAG: hypothetical protein ACLFWL_12805 [Candidatus Brocadiia bacterium]
MKKHKDIAEKDLHRWPVRGWVGIGLVAVFWALNWGLSGLRSHWAFFPLWVGYCLTVDALVYVRKGSSIFTRSRRGWIALFIMSVPGWWIFELLNARTQNWSYQGIQHFNQIEYFILSSLSFSTVVPAVLGTAELVGTFRWVRHLPQWISIRPARRTTLIFFAMGLAMLGLLLGWPGCFFPFLWLSAYFLLEPINVWLGRDSLLNHTARGDWRPVVALGIGCLICGFFWEMWNFYSYPKWVYRVPFVDFWHIFEMPLLGYGGYLAFSLELYALYNLLKRLFIGRDKKLVRLIEDGQ